MFRSLSGIPRPSFPLIKSDTHRYSLTYTPHAPLTHPHTHSLTHTLTHSPTHSLTHTLTHTHLHTTMCTAKGSDVGPCICFSFEWLFLKSCTTIKRKNHPDVVKRRTFCKRFWLVTAFYIWFRQPTPFRATGLPWTYIHLPFTPLFGVHYYYLLPELLLPPLELQLVLMLLLLLLLVLLLLLLLQQQRNTPGVVLKRSF